MNKGLDDKFVKKVDYDDIYRLAGYEFTSKFYQKAYGTIEREYMQSGCRALKTFTPLVDEYTFGDVSKSNFVYAYKSLIKELNKDQSVGTKEEIELILETINTLGKLNRDDENESLETNTEALNRIFQRCDRVGLELSDQAINQLAYEILKKDKRYQELKQTIQQLYMLYIKTHYDSNLQDFVDMINNDYNYDFSELFDGKSESKLTVEMLESFIRSNHVYFVKQLGNHLSTEKYVGAQEFGIQTGISLNESTSSVKREVLVKYQNRLNVLKNLKDRTIEHYVYMNVPEEDHEEFMKLFRYWVKTDELDEKQFSSPEAKKGVYEEVCGELKAEILAGEYNEVEGIVHKYKEWLIRFNSYRSPEKLKKFRMVAEKAKIKIADKEVSKYLQLISKALKNKENIYLLFKNNNILVSAFEDVLKNENSKYNNIKKDIEHIVNRYYKDREEYKKEKARAKAEQDKMNKLAEGEKIVRQFIEGNTASVKEFLGILGIHPKAFEEYVELIRNENLELYEEYTKKLMSQSRQRFIPVLENVQSICKKILGGVEENDDIRPFDYLDFKMATRMSLEEFADFVKKNNIVTNPSDVRKVMQFKSKNTSLVPSTTTETQIYEEKNVIGGREILLPIKKAIIAYLKSYGILNDYRAYKLALDRFLSRRLNLTEFYEEGFSEETFFGKAKTK